MSKALWSGLIVVALAGGGYFLLHPTPLAPLGLSSPGTGGSAPQLVAGGGGAILVEALAAETDSLAQSLEAVGTARARQSIAVRADASGRVEEILFTAGEKVAQGELLLRLDSAIEEATLAEAEALLADVRQQLERARQLLANRTIARARVDELEAAFQASQARVEVAKRRLDERRIIAPFPGIVGLQEVDVGARVTSDTVLTTLDDLSVVEVEFQVPELFFPQVATGQAIEAKSVAFPGRSFPGIISAIDARISEETRSFRVRAAIPNPDATLPSGLFMSVTLALAGRDNAILVPEEAILYEADITYLYVVENGHALRREVLLGDRTAGRVEVRDGLARGELVVTSGQQRLRNGVPVRLRGEVIPTSEGPS